MIIILKDHATDDQIAHVVERVESFGLKAHLSRGTFRTVIGVIGDEAKIQAAPLTAISGVAEVVPVLPPYKLASLDAHPQPTVVEVGSVKIGGGSLAMIRILSAIKVLVTNPLRLPYIEYAFPVVVLWLFRCRIGDTERSRIL